MDQHSEPIATNYGCVVITDLGRHDHREARLKSTCGHSARLLGDAVYNFAAIFSAVSRSILLDHDSISRVVFILLQAIVVEAAAVSVTCVHTLEEGVASGLCALPHASLKHIDTGGTYGLFQLQDCDIVLAKDLHQIIRYILCLQPILESYHGAEQLCDFQIRSVSVAFSAKEIYL